MFNWFIQNWFTILQSIGIIASLLFTALSLKIDAKFRRISNLIQISEQHRNILVMLIDKPKLMRVVTSSVNLEQQPISEEESWFVELLIQHLSTSYRAMRSGMLISPEGLQRDIECFFNYPITKRIWSKLKVFQDKEFSAFVEGCINSTKITAE